MFVIVDHVLLVVTFTSKVVKLNNFAVQTTKLILAIKL
jgi:hypothetical protein